MLATLIIRLCTFNSWVRELSKGDLVEIKAGKFANKKAVIEEIGDKKLKLILPEIGWKLTASIQEVV